MDKIDVIFFIFMGVTFLFLGWSCNEMYDDFIKHRNFNGIYIFNAENEAEVRDIVNDMERGDWVCINVDYEMTPEVAYKTCVHECTHKAVSEIYAEDCEENPSKCFEGIWQTNEK